MKIENKSIISGLIAGIVFVGIMAGFDYSDGLDFSIWKFVARFSFF